MAVELTVENLYQAFVVACGALGGVGWGHSATREHSAAGVSGGRVLTIMPHTTNNPILPYQLLEYTLSCGYPHST